MAAVGRRQLAKLAIAAILAIPVFATLAITQADYIWRQFLVSRSALDVVKCYYGESGLVNDSCLQPTTSSPYATTMIRAAWTKYSDDALLVTANKWRQGRYAILAWQIGFAQLMAGQLHQAVKTWEPAISVMPIEDVLLQNGNTAEQEAEFSRAEAQYLAYTLLRPSADRYELLGNFYLRAGQPAQAVYAFEQGAILGSTALEAYLQGRADELRGDLQSATRQYRQAISGGVEGIMAHVYLAKILAFRLGEWDAAIMVCQSAVERAPHDYACYEILGLIYARQEDIPSAVAWLESGVRQVDGRYAATYQSLFHQRIGYLLLKDGRLIEAESHFTDAIKLLSSNAEAYQGLASIYSRKGDLQAALVAIQKAIDAQLSRGYVVPHSWYVQLAETLERLGDMQQSLRAYQAALLLAPNDPHIIEREQALRNAGR
jgi:tetratricopeptide (TPR) repeat protein